MSEQKQNTSRNCNDPFVDQLERDARSILDAETDEEQAVDGKKQARMLAMNCLLAISMKREQAEIKKEMVTKEECKERHRPRLKDPKIYITAGIIIVAGITYGLSKFLLGR